MPTLLPNRYGPIVCSSHWNAATRFAVPVCASASSVGRYHTETCVPAAVVPSGSSVYASIDHASWYDGASAIVGGNTAILPAGTPVTASVIARPSRGWLWHGNRLPQ